MQDLHDFVLAYGMFAPSAPQHGGGVTVADPYFPQALNGKQQQSQQEKRVRAPVSHSFLPLQGLATLAAIRASDTVHFFYH